jgi:hypothetical protein
MFVPHSDSFNSIKIWLFDITSLILVLSVLVAVVIKDWQLLRDFLKRKDCKPEPKIEHEAEK